MVTKDYELLSVKAPRLIPVEGYVSADEIARLRGVENLVIGEIAGRDSIAAVIRDVEAGAKAVLPSVVYTGTDYGDWDQLDDNVAFLRRKLEAMGVPVYEPVISGDPRLWAALSGRFAAEIMRRYGVACFCTACHLYMHIVRVPLAKAVGAGVIISGERESHEGRIKLNQTAAALNAYARVIAEAGIELALPIRHQESAGEIEAMVGSDWHEGERQLKCVFSKNYVNVDGSVVYDASRYEAYLEEFLIPSGKRLISHILDGRDDYVSVIGGVLDGLNGGCGCK